MKQLIRKMWALMMVLLMGSATSNAEEFSVDWIYYNITSETDLTVEVTRSGISSGVVYEGSVVIPETVTYSGKTYSVTSIGERAFWDCSSLTSVTIPASVKTIEEGAFESCPNCSSLTSITVESTTPPKAVEKSSFSGCYSVKLRVPQGTLETYRNAEEWKNFTDIEEFDPSAIYIRDGKKMMVR